MAGKTLDLDKLLTKDQLGCRIADYWQTWNMARNPKINEWEEIRRYVFATDTTKTSNSKLPWNNKTTVPKLCQIRDNLAANYMATMFPKRRWLVWEGNTKDDQTLKKASAIRDYMSWVIDQPWFKTEVNKLVLDYIDYGNVIAIPEWKDDRAQQETKTQVGYVGPVFRRINPLDIVFNPIAPSFEESPKIIRSLVSLGEAKEILDRLSSDDADKEIAQQLYDYMISMRHQCATHVGDFKTKNAYLTIDGFSSMGHYLQGDYVEVLTFYGDIMDQEKGEFLRNHMVVVFDRHKVAFKGPHPSLFGRPPVYHAGWRVRQDNLWAMGPLDNLVGMQYRIDHIENMKADMFDLSVFPPLKVKGYVEDFEWAPFERIHVGEEGDVEVMQVNTNVLSANIEIEQYESKMEQMAGAPKEAMGFRTPGEKTMYEVQQLENAASRIFQSKIAQFEEQILEPILNAMLELARRHMDETVIRVIDDEYKIADFRTLGPADITGSGRIRPIAARHFAEKAQMVQNVTNFYASAVGADPDIKAHFSSIKLAEMFSEILDIEDYDLVTPYIRLTEQADAQRMGNAQQEDVMTEAMTPAGIAQGDI